MKKILFTLLALVIITPFYSQTYQGYVPFPTNGAVWIDNDSYENTSNPNLSYCKEREYFITKDTIINNKTYQKIEVTLKEFTNSPVFCWPNNYTVQLVGNIFIRNDSLGKKVWLLYGNSDTLLYDYNLQLNQTYPNTFLDPDTFMGTVTEIDTIYLDNKWRKRYKIADCNTHYLIEGVGSTLGFMNENFCHSGNISLKCLSINNIGVYPDTNANCRLLTSLSDNNQQKKIYSIYPNPTNRFINLNMNEKIQSIDVYNLQGQKVQEINPRKRKWELPKQNGLYLIRLQDSKGNVYTKKIIKN